MPADDKAQVGITLFRGGTRPHVLGTVLVREILCKRMISLRPGNDDGGCPIASVKLEHVPAVVVVPVGAKNTSLFVFDVARGEGASLQDDRHDESVPSAAVASVERDNVARMQDADDGRV